MCEEVVVAWIETHDVTTDKSALLLSLSRLVSIDSFLFTCPAAIQGGYQLGVQLGMMQTYIANVPRNCLTHKFITT
jgi:hypothetical protein